MAAAVIGAVAAVVGVGSGIKSALDADKRAKRAAELQAKLTYKTRQEEIRRLSGEYTYRESYNRAAIAESNLMFSGSSRRHLRHMQSTFARDLQWRRNAARLERKAIASGAAAASSGATITQGVAQIIGIGADYYASQQRVNSTNNTQGTS